MEKWRKESDDAISDDWSEQNIENKNQWSECEGDQMVKNGRQWSDWSSATSNHTKYASMTTREVSENENDSISTERDEEWTHYLKMRTARIT